MPGDSRPPFQPGHPGNPTGGRPKKTDEMRRAEDLMRSRSEQGVQDLIALSEKSADDQVRAKLLMFRYDQVFGKARQAVEVTGADGGPIATFDVKKLSDDELRSLLAIADRHAVGTGDGDGGAGGTAPAGNAPPR